MKVACQFRGRELTHANLGRDLLTKFAELIKDHGAVERQPLLEGKSMSIVIASTHKPKPQAPAAAEGRPAATEPGGGETPGGDDTQASASSPEPQPQPVAAAAAANTKTSATRASSGDATAPAGTESPAGGSSPEPGSAGE